MDSPPLLTHSRSFSVHPPLRFVHASDLHLDKTLEYTLEGPAHWEKRYLDVSQRAAERLFQTVLEENVDFLILSGNVLNANLAPPGILLFLLEQFEKLHKADIAVYWAGGEFDSPEDWHTAFPLPDSVRLFPSNTIQEFAVFERQQTADFRRQGTDDKTPIARIVGMSRNQQAKRIRISEFQHDPGGLFTIAVANGEVEPESLSQRHIDYWALGGERRRSAFHGNPRKIGSDGKPVPLALPEWITGKKRERHNLPPQPFTVHYPGSTIALSPQDTGNFGATLVEVNWGDEPVLTHFTTSPIRWLNDVITLDADTDASKLSAILREHIKGFRESQKDEDLFICWFVDIPPCRLADSLRKGNLTAELLTELRAFFGTDFSPDVPLTYPVSLSLLQPEYLPKQFYEQQTILGDFLRSVKHYQERTSEVIDLEPYLPKSWADEWENEDQNAKLLLAEKIAEKTEGKTEENSKNENKEDSTAEKKKEYRFVSTAKQLQQRSAVLKKAAAAGVELLSEEDMFGIVKG
ncbi:MAG: metallophosphoesterase [Planctomycetaceae bacterium]|nr:metallophosphoesterase [Planctomycetaceae bacterium]